MILIPLLLIWIDHLSKIESRLQEFESSGLTSCLYDIQLPLYCIDVIEKGIVAGPLARLWKTGAQVVYSKYASTELEFNGSNHLLLKEDDIVGILDTDDVKDLKPLGDRVLIKNGMSPVYDTWIYHEEQFEQPQSNREDALPTDADVHEILNDRFPRDVDHESMRDDSFGDNLGLGLIIYASRGSTTSKRVRGPSVGLANCDRARSELIPIQWDYEQKAIATIEATKALTNEIGCVTRSRAPLIGVDRGWSKVDRGGEAGYS
ncbi:hypothetical protein J5N97_022887 [Dioscorea zingiberensis]|uniref:Uncharacterized protein n=1 Tax=Dioscorea zingiberensis TaxID=325984 RepID=A0A9D5CC14_9LILI|nr:hypothetical protein J5N97_022887 [Dioscorea zingiberensis]